MAFSLPKLNYSYDALEPFIDSETLGYHHDLNHRAYVEKLNETLEPYPYCQKKSLEDMLTHLDELPHDILKDVQNNGGGHFNHTMLWSVLSPNPEKTPSGDFGTEFSKTFGTLEAFKTEVKQHADSLFGSGYIWLCLTASRELVLRTYANQDCPLSFGLKPIFLIDLWEHAHYIKYQNKRDDYIDAIWNIVDWKQVGENWEEYSADLVRASGIEIHEDAIHRRAS